MDAFVTVRYRLNNIIDIETLAESGQTFEEVIQELIKEEGILGIAEDASEVIQIIQIDG